MRILELSRLRAVLGNNIGYLQLIALVVSFAMLVGCEVDVGDSLQRAQNYEAAGNYRAAVIEIKTFLQQEPKNAKARWMLGQIYLHLENGVSAEKELTVAQSLGINDDSIVPSLAMAFVLQNKYDDVLKLVGGPTLSENSRGELAASEAIALLSKNDKVKAIEKLESALAIAPTSPWVQLLNARYLVETDQFESAKDVLAHLLTTHPKIRQGWHIKGLVHEKEKKIEAAEEAYSKAIEISPNSLPDRLKRGLIRLQRGDLVGAKEDVAVLNKIVPSAAEVKYLSGLVFFKEELYRDASDALEAAYAQDPSHFNTVYILSATYAILNDDARALDLAERAVALVPGHIPARIQLASMYLKIGRAKDAEDLVRPIFEFRPDDTSAALVLAASLLQQDKMDLAGEIYSRVSEQLQDNSQAQLVTAMGWITAGSVEKAINMLRQAHEVSPSDYRITQALVAALLQNGQINESNRVVKKYIEDFPSDPAGWNMLGTVLKNQSRIIEAKDAYQKALGLKPGHAAASLNIATIAFDEGDFKGARRYVEDALRENGQNGSLYFLDARISAEIDDKQRLLTSLKKAVELEPWLVGPRIVLAKIYRREGDPGAALEVLMPLSKLSDVSVQQGLAETYIELDRLEDAKRILTQLDKIQPNNVSILKSLAKVSAKTNDRKRLESSLDVLANLVPDDVVVAVGRARLLIMDGRFDDAEALLMTMDSLQEPEILTGLLEIATGRGDNAAIASWATRLYEIAPSTDSVLVLAAGLAGNERSVDAINLLSDWLNVHPTDARVARALATLHELVGNHYEAARILSEAVQRSPGDAETLNNLAWVLRRDDPGRALKYAQMAYQLQSTSVVVLDTYAEVLARNNQPELAKQMIDSALHNSGRSPGMALRRAEILHLVGEREAANSALNEVLASTSSKAIRDQVDAISAQWRRER